MGRTRRARGPRRIRRLTLDGDIGGADRLSRRMMGPFTQSYLPLGDIWLNFEHGNIARDYRRELHLADAVASVRYRVGDVHYTRELIASHPAGVIAIRLTADRPGLITFDARLSSPLRHTIAADGRLLRLRGVAPAHVDPSYYGTDVPVQYGRDDGAPGGQWAPGERPSKLHGRRTLPGMRFELALGIVAEDGDVSVSAAGWRVERATAVTLIAASATAFNGFDKDPARDGRDPGPIVGGQVARALEQPWSRLRDDTLPITARSSIACRWSCRQGRPTISRPIAASSIAAPAIPAWSSCCSSTGATCSSRAAGPARSRRTSRASGTRRSGRRGARTTRSTSTRR